MKLSKTGIGLLTRQYRAVLKKCLLINLGLWTLGATLATTTPARAVSWEEITDKPEWLSVISGTSYEIVLRAGDGVISLDQSSDILINDMTVDNNLSVGYNLDVSHEITMAGKFVATQEWVNGRGYVTESDLSDLIPDLDAEERYIFDTINSWNLASQSYVDSAINNISGYVPTSRTINGKALTGNITLTAADVGALPSTTALFSGNYNDLTNKPTIPTNTNQLTNGAGFITSSVSNLTNYYTKNESDESSKRENLTTQKGDTLNKASNTFSAMAENVPATKLRYNNKPTITGTNSTEFSLRGILNRKRFKMLDNLSTNGCIVANDNTTIFIEYKKEA